MARKPLAWFQLDSVYKRLFPDRVYHIGPYLELVYSVFKSTRIANFVTSVLGQLEDTSQSLHSSHLPGCHSVVLKYRAD